MDWLFPTMSCLSAEQHNQKCTLYGTEVPESNLSRDKKSSQVMKLPLKTSAPQLRWAKPLHITVNDESITYLLHRDLPEVPRIRKSARLAFLLCIYEMFWMVSNTKMYLAVILPWRSQRQACFSFWHLQAKSQGMGSPASPASMRGLSKGYGQKVTFQMLFLLFIAVL